MPRKDQTPNLKQIVVVNPKFEPGTLVFTRGVNDLAQQNPDFAKFLMESLNRHFQKDWGVVDEEDKKTNDEAVTGGDRVLSAYDDARFPKHGINNIWIITESDRSVTTVLEPDDY